MDQVLRGGGECATMYATNPTSNCVRVGAKVRLPPPVGGQPRPEHSRHIEGQTTENQNGESFQSSKTR